MILGAILLIFSLIIAFSDKDWDGTFSMALATVGLLVMFFMPLAGINESDAYVYQEKVISQEPIYSLETTTAVNGGFVLGIGEIGSSAKYYFYVKDEYGGLRLRSIYSDNCTIIETSEVQPSIKTIQRIPTFKSTLDIIMFWPNLRAEFFPERHYILYVPPDTVKKVCSGNINH